MSGLALALILSAALVHASWNYLLKKSGGGGFVWLFGALSTALYLPLAIAIVVYQSVTISSTGLSLIVASGVIHTAYYLLLDRAYRSGDPSLVYPMARAWREHRRTAIAVALLNSLSYILVLTAMVFTPVSYVAPAREISILFAALMGTQLLLEGQTGRRVACAGAMAVGVFLLTVG